MEILENRAKSELYCNITGKGRVIMKIKLCRFMVFGLLGVTLLSAGCKTSAGKIDQEDMDTSLSFAAGNQQIAQIAQTNSEVGLDDLKLAGVNVYDPEDRVRCVLGQPSKTENIVHGNMSKEGNKLYYQGVIVELLKGTGVARITSDSAEYPTARGLRVGDPVEKVYELYGKPKLEENDQIHYSFGKDDFDVFMVKLKDGKVSLVSVYLTN